MNREEDFVFITQPSKENRVANKKDGTAKGRGELTQAEEEQDGYPIIHSCQLGL